MRKLVLGALFVLQTALSVAQNPALKGRVIDAKSQKPLQNVTAAIQGTGLSVITNSDGTFSFKAIPSGNSILEISYAGYKSQFLAIETPASGETLELGVIALEEDITSEIQLSLVTITENDLGDENTGSESTSGMLQATRDTYQQAAAFNWGQARFRIRGLDNQYGSTMINGIVMNKLYDGRPQWSNWGGLNDATRNQEFSMGSSPSDYTFGGALGTQQINTRASRYRTGTRISYSGTNTNYAWRTMGTHASGLSKKGWAFVISASRRWAQEGYFEGTDYSANSVFASVEKKINDKHSINFTSIYAENSRGKSSPNTKEVTDLAGVRYNSYWGWQDGEKRNARDKDITEPINMLSHYWKISESTSLATNVAFQTGKIGNSRLDFQNGNNPDATYYRNLPSYYSNLGATPQEIENVRNNFLANRQINWNAMYAANEKSAFEGRSVYVLYEDRTDDTQWSANSILNSVVSNHVTLNAAVNFRSVKSHNFQNMLDLLGGQYFMDIDPFFQGDNAQSDLNAPNRRVEKGEIYGYNYNLSATNTDAFTQFKFNYRKTNFYLAQTFSYTEYQREGLMRNGIYADNSFGKSDKKTFENFGFKGGLTYKINGRHLLDFNGLYMTKAPIMRNVFSNARLNNNITPDITSERIGVVDASYIVKAPRLKARVTGFFNKVMNSSEISFFYAESIGDDGGDADAFVSEIVTGIEKQAIGGELGVEYQITSTIKASASASYGQYIYSDNAKLVTNDDERAANGLTPIRDFGTVYMKNYRQPGMPQQAYSFGLEYRDPKFWWIGANINYLADNYLSMAKILRTDNFTTNYDTGVSYDGANETTVRDILRQEKFDNFMLLNFTGGKSWRISKKNRNTIGFFASVNNALDTKYITGGFEQSRKATYPDLVADRANGTPSFGAKYFYGYGRTYFINLYINF